MFFLPTSRQCWKCSAASMKIWPRSRAPFVAATVRPCSSSSAAHGRSAGPLWRLGRIRPHPILADLIPSFRTCPCRALTRPKNDGCLSTRLRRANADAYNQTGLIGAPIRGHAIVIVNLDLAAAIPPIELLVGGKRGRGLQLILGEIEMIGAEVAVVSQPGPRDGKVLLSD